MQTAKDNTRLQMIATLCELPYPFPSLARNFSSFMHSSNPNPVALLTPNAFAVTLMHSERVAYSSISSTGGRAV